MFTKKENKGITLIALVVTIVVLLILAGISLNAVIGDNGIIQRALDASNKTDESSAGEEVDLAYTGCIIKKYQDSTIDVASSMESILQEQDPDCSVTGDEDYLEVTYKGYEFIIEDGIITSSGQSATEIAAVTDTNPGDITKDADGNTVSGTASDPYQICSIEDLVAFSDIVGAGQITSTDTYVELAETLNFKSTKSYVDSSRTTLTTTLLDNSTQEHTYSESIKSDLTSGTGFTPIGGTDGFTGTFDGAGNELKGLYINYVEENETYASIALFASNSGIIQNLNVSGSVTGTMLTEGGYISVSAIAGENYGTINKCTSKATILGQVTGNEYESVYPAGIISYNEGLVSNCANKGSVTGKIITPSYFYQYNDIAGIVATNCGSIENSYNEGKISAINCYGLSEGGIAGESYNAGKITNCYNTGTISADNVINFIETGGIVGYNGSCTDNGEVTNCYNIGTITISNSNSNGVAKGGIIGWENYFETVANNYDGTGIGAIGGQDFVGVAESADNLTVSSITAYINGGTHPDSKTQTYAISDSLKPGVYVKYDTSGLSNYQIPQSLAGTSSYTASQIVQPSSYTGGWQVLSNDGTTVEIISSDIVTIVNSYASSTQRLYLYGETGYKNFVTTLNTTAQAFLNTTYATSARSVGSTSSSVGTVTDTLQFKPTDYSQLSDMLLSKDYANMCYSGTATATSSNYYWLASRYCYCYSDGCNFYVRGAGGPGNWGYNHIFGVNSDGTTGSNDGDHGFRPIVSLKSGLTVVSGSGTSADPYVLGTN